jgi:integrase
MRKPARRTFADLAVQQVVRNEITTPRSRAGRRTLPLGSMAASALEEQYQSTRYRDPGCIVFSHPALGTPLDPSKLTTYARKALTAAGMPLSFRPSHGLRHTALTETAAAGVPPRAQDQLPGRRRACRGEVIHDHGDS